RHRTRPLDPRRDLPPGRDVRDRLRRRPRPPRPRAREPLRRRRGRHAVDPAGEYASERARDRREAGCHTVGVSRFGAAIAVLVARTGAIRSRVRGTCAVAYTARGVASVRRGAVFLGTHRLFAPRRPARLAPGVGAAIAANPTGTLLAVAVRRSSETLQLDVI